MPPELGQTKRNRLKREGSSGQSTRTNGWFVAWKQRRRSRQNKTMATFKMRNVVFSTRSNEGCLLSRGKHCEVLREKQKCPNPEAQGSGFARASRAWNSRPRRLQNTLMATFKMRNVIFSSRSNWACPRHWGKPHDFSYVAA